MRICGIVSWSVVKVKKGRKELQGNPCINQFDEIFVQLWLLTFSDVSMAKNVHPLKFFSFRISRWLMNLKTMRGCDYVMLKCRLGSQIGSCRVKQSVTLGWLFIIFWIRNSCVIPEYPSCLRVWDVLRETRPPSHHHPLTTQLATTAY